MEISHLNVNNIAAPTAEHQSEALAELARAAAANAAAVGKIAEALRGAEARMESGIRIDAGKSSE